MIRIGELSRRTGVGTDALRAWERRYELLDPVRSDGGYRLYDARDEGRVRAMRALLEQGVATAEAARIVRSGAPTASGEAAVDPGALVTALMAAIEALDEPMANAVLDEVVSALSIEALASRVVLPALREIGDRWARGGFSVAQEHFGSNLIRGRLLALARGWGGGKGPTAVLACVPGEQHDIGLIAFGLALRERGWRITYLGPDMPPESVASTARDVDADLVVLVAFERELLVRSSAELRLVADRHPLALAGTGVDSAIAKSLGAHELAGGPLEAARL